MEAIEEFDPDLKHLAGGLGHADRWAWPVNTAECWASEITAKLR